MALHIERTLPFQIHLHQMEALRKILSSDHFEKITDFQAEKTKEFYEFLTGMQGVDPNMPLLYQKLVQYMDFYFVRKGRNMSPFVFGRDYRPNLRGEAKHKIVNQIECMKEGEQYLKANVNMVKKFDNAKYIY